MFPEAEIDLQSPRNQMISGVFALVEDRRLVVGWSETVQLKSSNAYGVFFEEKSLG